MSKPITKIEMAGFRGAIGAFELDFDPNKDLVMLFGENGSGKSTILDAMDVVCNGTVGCLDGISVGQAPSKYLCSLGCQPSGLRVTVHSDGDSWTGTMQRNAISVAGHSVKPKVKILRRNAILELVLAQPSERYKALRYFLDIACVEQCEDTLQQLLTDTNRVITTLIEPPRVSRRLDSLRGLSHEHEEEATELLGRVSRPGRSAGRGTAKGRFFAMGCHAVDIAEAGLYAGDVASLGSPGRT